MLEFASRRVGVFIDVQNMYYSARNIYGAKVNFMNIVKKATEGKHLIRAIAYTVSTKTGDEQPFFQALEANGIDVKTRELLEYDSGHKKGDWDVGITIDMVKAVDMLDELIIVSGDGDYVELGQYIQAHGRVFHVVSFRESTSSKLVECADIYTNLSDDLASYLIKDPNYRPVAFRKSSSVDTFDDVIAEQLENKAAPKPVAAKPPAVHKKPRRPKAPPQSPKPTNSDLKFLD